jgi:hypothetical protein
MPTPTLGAGEADGAFGLVSSVIDKAFISSNISNFWRANLVTREEQVLLLIPLGAILLYFIGKDDPPEQPQTVVVAAIVTEGKEAGFLEYNKDEIFKNLIAAEGHFRNISEAKTGPELAEVQGFMNCAVKHLADAEGHADEAVSHTISDDTESRSYQHLRDDIRDLRHDLQKGKVTPAQGIKRTREIRRQFESFNPEFDISLCKACEING